MNEPRVIESVTNECQLLGRAHESSSARAEQLIACLEGEIAKRDAELERLRAKTTTTMGVGSGDGQLFIHGDYESVKAAQGIVIERDQLRAELAAIKVQETHSVEFRQFMSAVVTGAGLLSFGKQSKRLAAELSATAYKYLQGAPVTGGSQNPIGYRCWFNKEPGNIMVEWGEALPSILNPSATYQMLYAAPVSEAKAQGVRFCNKCGYHGPMETHNRPGDGVVCDYMSRAYAAPVVNRKLTTECKRCLGTARVDIGTVCDNLVDCPECAAAPAADAGVTTHD